jgi:hypothetical protein
MMIWMGHVAHMGEKRNIYKLLVGKPEGKRPPEDLGAHGNMLKRILQKHGGHGLDSPGPGGGVCYSNEVFGSIQGGKFLD